MKFGYFNICLYDFRFLFSNIFIWIFIIIIINIFNLIFFRKKSINYFLKNDFREISIFNFFMRILI